MHQNTDLQVEPQTKLIRTNVSSVIGQTEKLSGAYEQADLAAVWPFFLLFTGDPGPTFSALSESGSSE